MREKSEAMFWQTDIESVWNHRMGLAFSFALTFAFIDKTDDELSAQDAIYIYE